MQLTPYRLTLIALRLMAVFLFFAPVMKLIATIGAYMAEFVNSQFQLAWGNLIYAATVPFIAPVIVAWVVWRISPWVSRLIIAPLKREDEEGAPKPTAGEVAWEERQAKMRPAPKKSPGDEGGNKGWMTT